MTTSKVTAGLVDNGSAGRGWHLRHANLAQHAWQSRLHLDEHGPQLLRHSWMLGEEGTEGATPFRHYLAPHFLADRLRHRLHSRARIIELVTDSPLPALVTPADEIDVGRGEVLARPEQAPRVVTELDADLC